MSVDSSLLKKRVSQSASGLTKNIHSFHGSTHVEEEIVDLNPNLRLVLAGRGRTMCEPLIVQAVMEMVHPHPNNEQFENITKLVELVYLGTASYDAEQAFINQTHAYSALPNCTVTRLNVSDRASTVPTEAEIRQTLGKADIILSSGGNTLYAVTRWKKLGIDKILHELVLSKHPPIFCGGSAGAIVWFEHGHSDSMDPTTLLHVDPDLTEEEKKDWKYIR
jgi:dipeptidase E